jgi:hypothetical protein
MRLGTGVIGGVDPYTVLLLHCDGADGSTTFVDSSRSNHTVTVNGNAQIDTAQSKFGGASALFDGNNDFLTVPDHNDFEFGAGDFTLEFWYRTQTLAGSRGVLGKDNTNGGVFGPFRIDRVNTELRFWASSNGSSFDVANSVLIGAVAINTWYHVAVTRAGTTFRTFLDGVLGGTVTSAASLVNNANPLRIGATGVVPSGTSDHMGHLDEIRISKGTARWTANFTPPTVPYH